MISIKNSSKTSGLNSSKPQISSFKAMSWGLKCNFVSWKEHKKNQTQPSIYSLFGAVHTPLDTKPLAPRPMVAPIVICSQGMCLIAGSLRISIQHNINSWWVNGKRFETLTHLLKSMLAGMRNLEFPCLRVSFSFSLSCRSVKISAQIKVQRLLTLFVG